LLPDAAQKENEKENRQKQKKKEENMLFSDT
jgi:hypothetical protein